MKCKKATSAKALFGFFNSVFFASGFTEVILGLVLLSDWQRVLLSRLLVPPAPEGGGGGGPAQPPLYYLALGLLAAGLAVCAVAALGCWATYMPGYAILTIYFVLVLCLVLCECACGVGAAVWPRCAGAGGAAAGGAGAGDAVAALRAYYAVPDYEEYTAAVDLAQTQLECCGMTSGRNYDMSVWQLRRLGPRGMAVPPSCCVQGAGGAARSYLNPLPLNGSRCQESTPDPAFRYVAGCIDKLEEWYQQQYLIFMIFIFVAALSKLGLLLSTVFSCIRLRRRRTEEHFYMKSIDNKMNENLYESKMGTVRDEPIMAKYIQPNNFYSPRVRNPRIFPSRPNEMV